MLIELDIKNFAIIDHLSLSFAAGLNSFSGETGAGKSIVVDAISALLGGRWGTEFVRSGAEQARIEGIFDLPEGEVCLTVGSLLRDLGLGGEGDDVLILTREIACIGRSVARINGRPVSIGVLQEVGRWLVDINTQSEHLSLLRVPYHLELLDKYAGLTDLRRDLSNKVAALRQTRQGIQALVGDERELARRIDLLQFQIAEIRAAQLQPGEEEELKREQTILSNAERLILAADSAYGMLYEGEEQQRSVIDLLGTAAAKVSEISNIDPQLSTQRQTLEDLTWQVQDLARTLRTYRDSLGYDRSRLDIVEERLNLIYNLKRKYGNSVEEILQFAERAAAELEGISGREERLAQLREQERELLQKIGELSWRLSLARREAASRLAPLVEQELADLNMSRARFAVSIEQVPAADGISVEGSPTYAFMATGIDRVEFLIAPNPGEPLKPLIKIASGGETARVMLALKTILASVDSVPTLVFDEIDIGIGGRSGRIIGQKLANLGRYRQVICITHLPQIACFGDAHYNVSKEIVADRAVAQVCLLSEEERIEEMATMLGATKGSESARRSATDLLEEARRWKQAEQVKVTA
ncbi:MAG: DNA repair protein RecN [Chloroflexi bacterium]|nr:DNA repair protein RecN [Chloroflexota bacterium]MCL5076013.1 DNA repair protein RecN [Chloroflexota bacterium]